MLRDRQGFCGLAFRHVDRGDGEPCGLQARDDRLAVETHDRAVADERGAASQAQLSQPLTDALERAGRDDDPIRSAAEIDVDDHLDFPDDSPWTGEPPPNQATRFSG